MFEPHGTQITTGLKLRYALLVLLLLLLILFFFGNYNIK